MDFDLSWLTGRTLARVENGGGTWTFGFGADGEIRTTSPGRVIRDGGIVPSSDDHGRRYGLPQPVDAEAECRALLGGEIVRAAGVRDETRDLVAVFESGARLEVIPLSSGYESWHLFGPKGLFVVSQGGGDLAVWQKEDSSCTGRNPSQAEGILAHLRRQFPNGTFEPPAPADDIARAEREIGLAFPSELRCLYECCGSLADHYGLLLAPPFDETGGLVRLTPFHRDDYWPTFFAGTPWADEIRGYIYFGMDLANQRLFVEATSPHSIVRYEPSMGEACEPTKRQTIMALYENIGIDHYE